MSRHGNKPTDQGLLTFWRWQREALVRTREEIDRPRRTHKLETAEGGTCQDTKETDRPRRTHFLKTAEGALVRTRKQTDRPRRTHPLETVEGGTCQDMAKIRPTNAYSLPGDGRGRHLSGYGKNPTNRRALTSWGQQREAPVRAQKANRPTDAHSLSGNGRGRHL